MADLELEFPVLGLVDEMAHARQPRRTTPEGVNVRGSDPKEKRVRGGSRSGLSKYCPVPLVVGHKVQCLDQVVVDNRKVTYANTTPTAPTDITFSRETPERDVCRGVRFDGQSNLYALNGRASVVKYNQDGIFQWTCALPTDDSSHLARAMEVDFDGVLYAGMSEGGDQKKAKLWRFSERDGGKPEKDWEIAVVAFVERIALRGGLMYVALNLPDKAKSKLQVYSGLDFNSPTLEWEKEIPYPTNDLRVREGDGAIFTAHPPNALRGLQPRAPAFSARSRQWTIKDLVDVDKRLWGWIDATQVDDLEDGDPVLIVEDFSTNGRSLVQAAASQEPTFYKEAIGDMPAYRFNNNQASGDFSVESGANPSIVAGYGDMQRTLFPCFSGGRFALFMLVRLNTGDTTLSGLLAQDNNATGSGSNVETLCANRNSTQTTVASASGFDPGAVSVFDEGRASYAGQAASGGARSGRYDTEIASALTGVALITWLFDGNSSTTDHEQHSTFRVMGHPVDRYVSKTALESLIRTLFGKAESAAAIAKCQVDLGEAIVLGPYSDGGVQGNPCTGAVDSAGSHYPKVIGASTSTTWEAVSGNRYNDNEIERIEGYLAHKWGIAHMLPRGTATDLLGTGTKPANLDTVTIDGRMYTFVTAAPSSANEVQVSALADPGGATQTLRNLAYAVNGLGLPGTDYDAATTPHPTVACVDWMNAVVSGTDNRQIRFMSRSPSTTGFAVSVSSAQLSWSHSTSIQALPTRFGTAAYCPGNYVHPFYLTFGPPRKDVGATVGATLESKERLLTSIFGITAKWGPARGELLWAVTSRAQVVSPAGTFAEVVVGGLGHGVECGNLPIVTTTFSYTGGAGSTPAVGQTVTGATSGATGMIVSVVSGASASAGTLMVRNTGTASYKYAEVVSAPGWTGATVSALSESNVYGVYSTGPSATISTTDNSVLRRIIDYGDHAATVVTDGGWGLASSVLGGGAASDLDYAYPRLAVDSFDNIYLPYTENEAAGNKGAVAGISKAGVALWSPVVFSVTPPTQSLVATPQGLAVAVDPKVPIYGASNLTRAESIVVATNRCYTPTVGTPTLWRVRLVTPSRTTGSSRVLVALGVANGYIKKFTTSGVSAPAGVGTLPQPELDGTADWVMSTSFFGKVFFTDGKSLLYYDPVTDKVLPMKAEDGGAIPPRCKLIDNWRGRLVLLRSADDGTSWDMAEKDRPFNWNASPKRQTSTQAISGKNARCGRPSDIINTSISYSDDLFLMGCDSSIWRLSGDPMAGGELDQVTKKTGMAFGRSWTMDPEGVIYFAGSQGGVWRFEPGGSLDRISEFKIDKRLEAFNYATYTIQLAWNPIENGLHVFQVPLGAGGILVKHWYWERKSAAWWEDEFGHL